MGSIVKAIPALAVALGAVIVATLMIKSHWFELAILAAFLIIAGGVFEFFGRRSLPQKPVRAVYLMEMWLLVPLTLAALAGGVIICVAILATPDETWTNEAKEIVKAFATALTTFLSVVFIKDSETADESWLAKRIEKVFHNKYENYFQVGNPGRNIVFDLHRGWGRDERRKRAQELVSHLSKK